MYIGIGTIVVIVIIVLVVLMLRRRLCYAARPGPAV
jgi:Sec-independent protein translocase protein TatA